MHIAYSLSLFHADSKYQTLKSYYIVNGVFLVFFFLLPFYFNLRKPDGIWPVSPLFYLHSHAYDLECLVQKWKR